MAAIVSETHDRAIKWASSQFAALKVELVSESPWATVYKVHGPTESSYLKIFPSNASKLVSRAIQIAQQFPGHVPEIISSEAEEGWILSADHGGLPVWFRNADDQLTEIASCLGSMQAEAAKSAELLSQFDLVDMGCLQQDLMDFLSASAAYNSADSVGAAHFIGEEEANRYFRLLGTRAPFLALAFSNETPLPPTLTHGDLNRSNVFVRPKGGAVFVNWDKAAQGPAGFGLHQIFNGQPAPIVNRIIEAYITALNMGGYSTRPVLEVGIRTNICAGQMHFITSFGRYPEQLPKWESASEILNNLTVLLDVCDLLADLYRQTAMFSADDYELCGEWFRAGRHLEVQLRIDEKQPELLTRSANLAYKLHDARKAHENALKAFSLAPEDTAVRLALARANLGLLDLPASAELLTGVLAVEPEHPEAKALLTRVHAAVAIQEHAAEPKNMPLIAISSEERKSNRLETDTLKLMVDLFKRYGAVQVDNVFAPDLIERLAQAFASKYGSYFHDIEYPDASSLGEKRNMVTIEMDELFGSEELVASRLLLPFINEVFGGKCILNSYTCVISLPGSPAQRVHRDHPGLFEELDGNSPLPTYTLQLFLPLVSLNEIVGATRVFKGTQALRDKNRFGEGAYQDPVVPLGSCYFVDYSTVHAGMGNHSDKVRPILDLTYSRTWFRDPLFHAYETQPPLKYSRKYFDVAPNDVKALINWWNIERRWPEIN